MANDITKYSVKGYWSKFGAFNGSLYNSNKKFGTVVRVQIDIINCLPSMGKEKQFKIYKKDLKDNKLTQYNFLSDKINNYIVDNPKKNIC